MIKKEDKNLKRFLKNNDIASIVMSHLVAIKQDELFDYLNTLYNYFNQQTNLLIMLSRYINFYTICNNNLHEEDNDSGEKNIDCSEEKLIIVEKRIYKQIIYKIVRENQNLAFFYYF